MPLPKDFIKNLQCRATAKTGLRCRRFCAEGATVCFKHGAGAPQVRRKALDRRLQRQSWRAAINFLGNAGYRQIDDPVEALAELAGEVWAAKDYFASKIEQLRYSSQSGEQLRAEVALYERALDRCIKVLEVMARLGISERRTKVAEAQAILLAAVIQNVLGRLELSPDQEALALSVVPEELRAITAPEPELKEWSGAGAVRVE